MPVFGLPAPQRDARLRFEAHDDQNQVNYNIADEARRTQENQERFNEQQKAFFEEFMALVDGGNGGVMFVSAPGGTDKSFLLATILSKIRSRGEIAIATAASGIAATLLAGGKTVHSMFKVPLNTARSDTLPTCNINRGTALAKRRQSHHHRRSYSSPPHRSGSTRPHPSRHLTIGSSYGRNSYAPVRRFPSDSSSHSPRNTRRHRPRLHQIITHLAPYSTTRTSNQHQSPTYPSSGRRIRRLTDSYRK